MRDKTLIPLSVRLLRNLTIGEEFFARTSSNSMLPTIKPGQKVKIRKVPFYDLKVGDIIAYAVGKKRRLILHRIIRVHFGKHPHLQTKGDNVSYSDNYVVGVRDIIGKAEVSQAHKPKPNNNLSLIGKFKAISKRLLCQLKVLTQNLKKDRI